MFGNPCDQLGAALRTAAKNEDSAKGCPEEDLGEIFTRYVPTAAMLGFVEEAQAAAQPRMEPNAGRPAGPPVGATECQCV